MKRLMAVTVVALLVTSCGSPTEPAEVAPSWDPNGMVVGEARPDVP